MSAEISLLLSAASGDEKNNSRTVRASPAGPCLHSSIRVRHDSFSAAGEFVIELGHGVRRSACGVGGGPRAGRKLRAVDRKTPSSLARPMAASSSGSTGRGSSSDCSKNRSSADGVVITSAGRPVVVPGDSGEGLQVIHGATAAGGGMTTSGQAKGSKLPAKAGCPAALVKGSIGSIIPCPPTPRRELSCAGSPGSPD
jgi:hypothetical protein